MDSLHVIASEVRSCTKCRLCETRTNAVPGVGDPEAKILFIGEGPGKDEDLQGEPFVGRAGKLLTTLLNKIGIERKDVFITNVVKCRPPNNRDPEDDEIAACWPYLDRQIHLIDPRVIVTLGRHSMKRFLPGYTISSVHGEPKRRQSDGRIIFPLYHPAMALYKPAMLDVLEKDMFKLKTMLAKIEEGTVSYKKDDSAIAHFSTEVPQKEESVNPPQTLF